MGVLRCQKRGRDESGVSVIEFALVFPLVMAVMFGVIQYGVYFWGRSTAAAVARESARQLAVGTDWACSKSQALSNSAPALSGADASRRYVNGTNTAVIGDLVEVTVTSRTLAPSFFPLPDGGQITEVARATVQNIPNAPLSCS